MDRVKITSEEFFPEGHVSLRAHLEIAALPGDAFSEELLEDAAAETLAVIERELLKPSEPPAEINSGASHEHDD
jgi:hypothetical protein